MSHQGMRTHQSGQRTLRNVVASNCERRRSRGDVLRSSEHTRFIDGVHHDQLPVRQRIPPSQSSNLASGIMGLPRALEIAAW